MRTILRKKTTLILPLCVLLLAVFSAVPATASIPTMPTDIENDSPFKTAFWKNRETGYTVTMRDEETLFSEAEFNRLLQEIQPVTAYGNAALVTTSEYSTTTEQYASRKAQELIGENGTMFIIDMWNRNIYIYSRGDVWKTITNSNARLITDNTYWYAHNGDYYTCASRAYSQILDLLEGRHIAQSMRYITSILLALFCGLMLNFYLVRRTRRRPRTNEAVMTEAIAASAALGGAATYEVYKRVHINHESNSEGNGGGGGDGGSSGGGGGHSF